MLGTNYRVFNGIDSTLAYNLQALIKILFQYQNNFDEEYLKKVYRLFLLILGISEEIVKSLNLSLEDIKYDEQRKVILPSSDIVSKYAEKADGREFENWVTKELSEIFMERKVSQTITEDAPLLSFTIE